MILSFILAVKENLKGYVVFDEIKISKTTNNTFENIREAKLKGRRPSLVKAEIEFTWIAFKDSRKATDAPAGNTEPVIQNAPEPVKEQGT
jgi:hypothetical protein